MIKGMAIAAALIVAGISGNAFAQQTVKTFSSTSSSEASACQLATTLATGQCEATGRRRIISSSCPRCSKTSGGNVECMAQVSCE